MATSAKKKAPPPPPVEVIDRTGWKYYINGELVTEAVFNSAAADHTAYVLEQARLAALPEEKPKRKKK